MGEMMNVRFFYLLLVLASVVGCANKKYTLDAPFNEEAVVKQLKDGGNTVRGSGFIRQRNGGLVTCAGGVVSLMPITERARQWSETMTDGPNGGYVDLSGRGYVFPNNPELFKFTRESRCDVAGKFEFSNVGDGDWFIFTRITWQIPGGTSGGLTIVPIRLAGSRTIDVVLAP